MFLSQMLMSNGLLSNNLLCKAATTTAKTIIKCLIQLANLQCFLYCYSARSTFNFDHLLYDITPEEEFWPLLFKPHQASPVPLGTTEKIASTMNTIISMVTRAII